MIDVLRGLIPTSLRNAHLAAHLSHSGASLDLPQSKGDPLVDVLESLHGKIPPPKKAIMQETTSFQQYRLLGEPTIINSLYEPTILV